MKPIPYGRQNITPEDINSVISSLTSDFLTQGPAVSEFEGKFANYIGCKYAVAVSNGTAALHLCALALNVNEQTNAITSPITFAASANCIKYCGGNIFFGDIDPETYSLDPVKTEELIKSKPPGFFNGIVVVDFAGYAVNLEAFRKIAQKYNLWIIEDACHSPGGYFIDTAGNTQKCGNGQFADLAVFSFHPVKHIACGEGGMITTNDKTLYERLLLLRTHGITRDTSKMAENHGGWYYEMVELGYNYRLTDFQAALGTSQLKRADEGLKRRKEIAAKYNAAFDNKAGILSHSGLVDGHAYHLYIIRVSDRKRLYDFLRTKNIYAQVHYVPVYKFPFYHKENDETKCPAAEQYYSECLSLPMFPSLTDEEQSYVIDCVLSSI